MGLEITQAEQKEQERSVNFFKRQEEEEADLAAEKGQIEGDMLKMAKGMKEFANSFKGILIPHPCRPIPEGLASACQNSR